MRDPAVTSRIMGAIRSSDTKPELWLRHTLHRRGLRYRLRYPLPGRPDRESGLPRVSDQKVEHFSCLT